MQKLVVLLLFLFQTLFAKAQSYSIYQNITTSNGLPSNYVFASAEDENGFLWVGTDKGLCRFDGFRWKVWDKDNGLPGNYVNTVLPDKRGGLWIGISDKGYFHFNPLQNKLRPLPLTQSPILQTVQTDKDGNLYAETYAPSAYLFHPGSVSKPEIVYQWKSSLPLLLRGDAKKSQVYGMSTNAKVLAQVKQAWKGKWPLRLLQLEKPFYGNSPVYFVGDSIFISATEYFLFSADGKIRKKESLFPSGNTYAYTCSTDSGLYIYNIKTGYYFFDRRNRKSFYDRRSGLGTDYVSHIYPSSDGTVIISTLGAGLQIIKSKYRKTFFTDNNTARSILADGDSWYVLAGDHVFKTTKAATHFLELGKAETSTLNLLKWGDTLIAGTLRGTSFFIEKNSTLQPLGSLELNAGISSVIRNGNHFLAGTYGSGLFRFRFDQQEQTQSNYPFRIIEKLVPLSTGFAALSYEDGILLNNTATNSQVQLSQKDGLLSNSVYSIYQRADTSWIGTKGGVAIYTKGKVVQSLRFPEGLAFENAIACFHDTDGKFWVVSNRNLYSNVAECLRPLSSFPLITEEDVISTAVYNSRTNELGIGSNKTFSIISLRDIRPTTSVSIPRLTDIYLNGEPTAGQTLTVPYDFKTLLFSVAPLSALPFSKTRFYYKLLGLTDEWKEMKDSLTISFSGLRQGDYVLLGKSVNQDGYESRQVQLTHFTVQKPYWLRWPFLLFCVGLIVSITVILVQQVEKAKRRKREAALLLQQTIQAERQRIAKDLHDHLGTNLVTIIAQTDNIETRLNKGDVTQASQTVQHLSAQSRETMNVLRETIWAVQETEHSLSQFLLRIRTFLQRFFESTGLEWEVKSTVEAGLLLSPTHTLHLFRIIQEASQNILKHAGATKAKYSFSLQENKLQVTIQDNGSGFTETKHATNGMANIQERVKQLNGELILVTTPSVSITISLPL